CFASAQKKAQQYENNVNQANDVVNGDKKTTNYYKEANTSLIDLDFSVTRSGYSDTANVLLTLKNRGTIGIQDIVFFYTMYQFDPAAIDRNRIFHLRSEFIKSISTMGQSNLEKNGQNYLKPGQSYILVVNRRLPMTREFPFPVETELKCFAI